MTQIRNCYSGDVIGSVPSAARKSDAKELFDWLSSPFRNRMRDATCEIHRLGAELSKRKGEIAAVYSAESGKPLRIALAEISRSAHFLENAGSHIDAGDLVRPLGDIHQSILNSDRGHVSFTVPSGLSTVEDAAISAATSTLQGKRSVIAPGAFNPLTIITVGEEISKVENLGPVVKVLPFSSDSSGINRVFPEDRISSLNLFGTVRELDRNFRKYNTAADYHLIRKGISAAIIWKDSDADMAVESVINGAFLNDTGFDDIKYIIIHPEQAKYVQNQITEKISALSCGNPSLPETDIGPAGAPSDALAHEKYLDDFVKASNEYIVRGTRILPNFLTPSFIRSDTGNFPSIHDQRYKFLVIADASSIDQAILMLNRIHSVSTVAVFTSDIHFGAIFSKRLNYKYLFFNGFPSSSTSPVYSRSFDLQRMLDITASLTTRDQCFKRVFYEE